jgi:hypothetical protein
MGKVYDEIDDKLEDWLMAQPMFFVSTAPLAGDGHVNLSPKGMAGTFAVLGPAQVAYLDYFGSGAETIAHVRENGRIVLMWCAFSGPPQIVRLHGRGTVVLPDDPTFVDLRAKFAKTTEHAVRSIIVVDVDRTSDSCGYSVPKLVYVEDRDILDLHHAKRPAEYYEEYAKTKNAASIDGLPALG